MTAPLSLRSQLIVPASAERFVARAAERGADAIILDLEDGVAPAAKAEARARLATAVPQVGARGATVFVRINATPALMFDDAAAAAAAGAFGLMVPKTRAAIDLLRLEAHLAPLERGRAPLRFVPILEDPGAVFEALAIARATPRVLGMSCGAEDYALALGAPEPLPEVLRLPKQLVHMAARAAGVMSFGLFKTVADYNDLDGIRAAAEEARRFGFDGATCIHPQVVPILNAAFTPPAADVERATRIVELFDAAVARGEGAISFEGKMLDEPVVARARALVARAARARGETAP
jgi:citrate lyase subunit beta/citryl-CoA lyase